MHSKNASEKFYQDSRQRKCSYQDELKNFRLDKIQRLVYSEQRKFSKLKMMNLLLSLCSLAAPGADASTAVGTCSFPSSDSGPGSLEVPGAGVQQLGGTPLGSCHAAPLSLSLLLGVDDLRSLSGLNRLLSVSNVIINIDRCRISAPRDTGSAPRWRLLITGCSRLQHNLPSPISWIGDSNLLALSPLTASPGSRQGGKVLHLSLSLLTCRPAFIGARAQARADADSPTGDSLRHCSWSSSYFVVIDGIVATRLTNCKISKVNLYDLLNLILYFYLYVQVYLEYLSMQTCKCN